MICHVCVISVICWLSTPPVLVLSPACNQGTSTSFFCMVSITWLSHGCHVAVTSQGPPGTGKTSTIIAIISALLGKHYIPSNPKDPQAKRLWPALSATSPALASNAPAAPSSSSLLPGSTCDARSAGQGIFKSRAGLETDPAPSPKFRILVCAQSNAAIDEVIARLASPGLLTGESCSMLRQCAEA